MALTLSGDDGVAGVNGSATTPAIQGTDTNTGLTFGTDTVNVVTGGSTRATVDSSGVLNVSSGDLRVTGTEGISASLYLIADQGDDNGDGWRINSNQDDNDLTISTNTTGSYVDQVGILTSGDFRFNSGYGSVATAYGCRAWINFDGTTSFVRDNGNASSITDNGTGNYTVNFTSSLPDDDYAAISDFGNQTSGGTSTGSLATTGFVILTMDGNFSLTDRSQVFAAVFR